MFVARICLNKMLRFIIVCVLISDCYCLYVLPKNQEDTSLQIKLASGSTLQGRKVDTPNGNYYAYLGIPYAAAPIDDLRFRAPMPPPIWDGILDATRDGDICTQITNEEYIGSENCLFINVYTKQKPKSEISKKIPVMVWIYGGAFIAGDSKFIRYGPEYLLQKDVVVITFNYRLGIFGFLSTEDMSSPGNYGLKDQIAALQWIQANIDKFGGDRNQVTIFGESAGGASVNYLLLAPKAKGLFHKAISESGSALCPWALQRHPRNIAYQVGIVLGIITLSTDDLVDRLRSVDFNVLQTVATSAAILNLISPLNGLAYSPTIEPKHEGAILSEGAHELFRTGKFNRVPYIIGFNSEESSILQEMVDFARPYLLSYDVLPTNVIPEDMNIPKISLDYIQAAYKIKTKYFGIIFSTSIATKESILKFISDIEFVKAIRETVKLISKYSPVYFYEFSYEGDLGLKGNNMYKNDRSDNRLVQGVGHAEEMWYLWKSQNLTFASKDDIKQRNILTTLWTNFGKTSNPTPKYEKLFNGIKWVESNSSNHFKLLNIGDDLVIQNNPREDDMEFWDDLYEEFGRPPYDTY